MYQLRSAHGGYCFNGNSVEHHISAGTWTQLYKQYTIVACQTVQFLWTEACLASEIVEVKSHCLGF